MIVEFLMKTVVDVLLALLTRLPGPPVPAFLSSAEATVQSVMDGAAGFSNFVPFDVAGQCALAVGIALVAGITVKVARMVISLLTAGGGSAA